MRPGKTQSGLPCQEIVCYQVRLKVACLDTKATTVAETLKCLEITSIGITGILHWERITKTLIHRLIYILFANGIKHVFS